MAGFAKGRKRISEVLDGKHKRQKVPKLEATLTGDQDDFPESVLASEPELQVETRRKEHAVKEDNSKEEALRLDKAALEKSSNAKAKARKKRRGKVGWEDTKALSKDIANASLESQAQWLWDSFAHSTGSSVLERAGLEVSSMLSLQKDSALEDALSDCEGVGSELQYGDKAAHGSPLILVLTSSAASANDIAKKLPNLNRICRVSKLFAKHFKIEEQSKDLQSRCVNIATGTPHRMGKLVELESLKLDRMKLLILDAALDAKQRTILDVPEVCKDLWAFFQSHIKPLAASGQLRLALMNSSELH